MMHNISTNRMYNKIVDRDCMVLRAPICHVIGARSRGCPITGVRFELFQIGHQPRSQGLSSLPPLVVLYSVQLLLVIVIGPSGVQFRE